MLVTCALISVYRSTLLEAQVVTISPSVVGSDLVEQVMLKQKRDIKFSEAAVDIQVC
jgi:hypothetical protein